PSSPAGALTRLLGANARAPHTQPPRRVCACRYLPPDAGVLCPAERTRGQPSLHVRDGGARAGTSPRTRTYSFLRSARAGNLLRTRAYLLKNKSPTCTPIQTN